MGLYFENDKKNILFFDSYKKQFAILAGISLQALLSEERRYHKCSYGQ